MHVTRFVRSQLRVAESAGALAVARQVRFLLPLWLCVVQQLMCAVAGWRAVQKHDSVAKKAASAGLVGTCAVSNPAAGVPTRGPPLVQGLGAARSRVPLRRPTWRCSRLRICAWSAVARPVSCFPVARARTRMRDEWCAHAAFGRRSLALANPSNAELGVRFVKVRDRRWQLLRVCVSVRACAGGCGRDGRRGRAHECVGRGESPRADRRTGICGCGVCCGCGCVRACVRGGWQCTQRGAGCAALRARVDRLSERNYRAGQPDDAGAARAAGAVLTLARARVSRRARAHE